MRMIYSYLWVFFLFSFLGWCSEVIFAAIRQKRFVNRGFLNGPLCPIYGLGVVLIDALLRPFGDSLAIQLVGSMLLGSALEYLAGFRWKSCSTRNGGITLTGPTTCTATSA